MKTLFRASPARGIEKGKAGVDRENKIIYGAAVISKGEAKGHGVLIDDMTLDQVVELSAGRKVPLKSRFGHPNMSSNALGTFLGRVHNVLRDGDVVRGDLHLADSSFNTPNGDLGTYVLDLAEEDPDAFGMSIVFDGETAEQTNEDGTPVKDEAGNKPMPFARVKKLWASDVVDDPAANESLFERGLFEGTNVQLSAEMTQLLEKFLDTPDAVKNAMAFLERFAANKEEVLNIQENETIPKPKKEDETMDFTSITAEQLKAGNPDLYASIQKEGFALGKDEGVQQGIKDERARAVAIAGVNSDLFGAGSDLVLEALDSGASIEDATAKLKDAKFDAVVDDTPQTPGPSDEDEESLSSLSDEEKWQREFEKDAKLRAEFGALETYLAYKRNEKNVRILKK